MRETRLSLPQVFLIASTRGMLGAGLALLLSNRLTEAQCKAIGWTLFFVGAVTTVPLAFEVLGSGQSVSRARWAKLDRYSVHA